jgi:hypothetical protein
MMRLKKRTYALPLETIARFEERVEAGRRSAVVAHLLRDWLAEQERLRLRQEIIKGCRDMADLYLEIEREYHPLEEEVHRALDAWPQTRRRRPRSS